VYYLIFEIYKLIYIWFIKLFKVETSIFIYFMVKKFRERFKTFDGVFDEFTARNIFTLASKGLFDEKTLSPISIGKESNVFSARSKGDDLVILKVYRLNTCDFGKMWHYLRFDPRYVNVKRSRRSVIFSWALREYKNLFIARKAGLNCPKPLGILNNVLVMEFVGGEFIAPKVKDLYPKSPKKFFDEIVEGMVRFLDYGFVHGDLSGFNILNFDGSPVFIDFSQSMSMRAPNARELLESDVRNVCNFFSKKGLKVNKDKVKKSLGLE